LEICCTICNSLALFTKATLLSLFILPIAYGHLAACLAGFAPADGIGQFKLVNAEVFEQVPDVRVVVNGQHDFAFTLTHYFGQQFAAIFAA
jgi:hypothetical protein